MFHMQVIFPYDEFLKLCNWRDLDYLPCGLLNCGNRYNRIVLYCTYVCLLCKYLLKSIIYRVLSVQLLCQCCFTMSFMYEATCSLSLRNGP